MRLSTEPSSGEIWQSGSDLLYVKKKKIVAPRARARMMRRARMPRGRFVGFSFVMLCCRFSCWVMNEGVSWFILVVGEGS